MIKNNLSIQQAIELLPSDIKTDLIIKENNRFLHIEKESFTISLNKDFEYSFLKGTRKDHYCIEDNNGIELSFVEDRIYIKNL